MKFPRISFATVIIIGLNIPFYFDLIFSALIWNVHIIILSAQIILVSFYSCRNSTEGSLQVKKNDHIYILINWIAISTEFIFYCVNLMFCFYAKMHRFLQHKLPALERFSTCGKIVTITQKSCQWSHFPVWRLLWVIYIVSLTRGIAKKKYFITRLSKASSNVKESHQLIVWQG